MGVDLFRRCIFAGPRLTNRVGKREILSCGKPALRIPLLVGLLILCGSSPVLCDAVIEMQIPDSLITGTDAPAEISISESDSVRWASISLLYNSDELEYDGVSSGFYWQLDPVHIINSSSGDTLQITCRLQESAPTLATNTGTICTVNFIAEASGKTQLCVLLNSLSKSRAGTPPLPIGIDKECEVVHSVNPDSMDLAREDLRAYNYPNPVLNGERTNFSYVVGGPGSVQIWIYDLSHELVARTEDHVSGIGRQSTLFDTSLLVSGTYIFVIEVLEELSGKRKSSRGKLVVVR